MKGVAGVGAFLAGGGAALGQPDRSIHESPAKSEVSAIVLGSAQDGGVPHAGCRCDHCNAARSNPRLRRRSPSLAVLHEGEMKSFVIDAGPDFPNQLDYLPRGWAGERNPVHGIFLSHAHIGHYLGLAHLGREVLSSDRLPVWCSERMAAFLRENAPWSLLVDLENIELRVIRPGEPVTLAGNLSVTPIEVLHRGEFTDTLFFKIEGPGASLLYLTDIDRWDGLKPPIEELAADADISLLDGTFYSPDELPGRDMSEIPHPPVSQTMDRLQHIADKGKNRIFFTHLNHSNLLLDSDGEKLRALRERGFDVVFDGKTFEL
jgi:pyrroloquinoline quinone biosynthesis protein B